MSPRLQNLLRLAAVSAVAGAVFVLWKYGGGNLWPGLVTGFGGSLLAFMLALTWEREREISRGRQQVRELSDRRNTEARRRFEPIRAELEKNAESLDALRGLNAPSPGTFQILNPQLLEGAWMASAARLSELIADYKLIADLATTYGRIEELRWRLRYRTEHLTAVLDGMTAPLVEELRGEVADLLKRVGDEIENPSVQPSGLLHVKSGTLVAGVTTSATIDTEVIRGE